MSYKNKRIKQLIEEIEDSRLFLPALQRKFVWDKPQIELLFDSIMRNFPIGTFLFWNLKSEVANNYVFYEFLREYNQREPYNKRKVGNFLKPEIVGVLDGQQRLSSMYIGLQGTHTEKIPWMRKGNENAYRKTSLFLNILSIPYYISKEKTIEIYEDQNFEFRFLTEEESEKTTKRIEKNNEVDDKIEEITENVYWFKVGEVLKWGQDPEFDEIINSFIDNCKEESQKISIISKKRLIKKAIETLYKRITTEELINYFEITKNDLEDILKIFVRVNSGGTKLNKTDLLFSTIVATWDDGRDRIEDLLKKINLMGDGFVFTNEYLMRCCLVLTDAPVLYKVNSFKSENVQKIKNEWDNIAKAILKTVDLLVEFGFNKDLLTSLNSTIIIAYYIYKGGLVVQDRTKLDIKKYLIHALLKGIYGSSQDQLISILRNSLRTKSEHDQSVFKLKNNEFSFDELLCIKLPSSKSLQVSEVELDEILSSNKGASTFFVLSLLYPDLRYKEVHFHQDHIHPASKFTIPMFDKLNISKEDREEWTKLRDKVPNLQLMEGRQNEAKNATEFSKWLSNKCIKEQSSFKQANYIPDDISLEFKDFKEFFEKRKNMLKIALRNVLAMNNNPTSYDDEVEYESYLDELN